MLSVMQHIENFTQILQSFKIKAECIDYKEVDNYFFYDVKLQPFAKVKDISKFSDEISLALKTNCKPGIKILHSQGIVRLEFSNPRIKKLNLFEYFTSHALPKYELPCLLGQAVDGQKVWMDLAINPHMIIAGTTGSGKSTLLHNIIANLLNYTKTNIFLIDPKNIEFSEYKKIKSIDISYTYEEALYTLDSLLVVMESRYERIRDNSASISNMPYIVLIIDEFADLIMQDKNNEFYSRLCKLAQKCRAAKIRIILSTQRPSVDVINGLIKANFPARIACKVTSHIDSKIILDAIGAENLAGKGDALIRDNSRYLERFQIAYTDAEEVCRLLAN